MPHESAKILMFCMPFLKKKAWLHEMDWTKIRFMVLYLIKLYINGSRTRAKAAPIEISTAAFG